MGVSGSGKSSVAKTLSDEYGIPFIEGDNLHPQANIDKMSRGEALDDDDRWSWLTACADEMNLAHNSGYVITCSALKKVYREHIRNQVDHPFHIIYLKGSMEIIKERMAARENHFMPTALLQSQFDTLEIPQEALHININKPLDTIKEEIMTLVAEAEKKMSSSSLD